MTKLLGIIMGVLCMTSISRAVTHGIEDVTYLFEGDGQILHGDAHAKGKAKKEQLKISFDASVIDAGSAGYEGNVQVRLHNVGDDQYDKTSFYSDEIIDFNWFAPSDNSCISAVNFTAIGTFDGQPNYKLIMRAGDSGEPASAGTDTLRIQLYAPGGTLIYDSNNEFSKDSSCVGTERTFLDRGDISIHSTSM